ncbi:MAG: MBL fold metallo-hydrolase [Thermoproteaceae archaeon]|nr:MBL fold metallo-hydrolase [Thermoproteaceae archaeon]
MPYRYQDVEIYWLGHDAFRVLWRGLALYIDPYQLQAGEPKADVILVTHEHFDHCDPPSIRRVLKPSTAVVAPRVAVSCVKRAAREVNVIEIAPGERKSAGGINVTAYPAYNINKFRDPARRAVFHPREDGRVAYMIELGSVRVFHAGDSDFIPEFRDVRADILLVPVSGVYVMTPQEAAEFVNTVSPRVAIPMHYGSIVASRREAEEFKRLVKGRIEVVILEREL